MQLFRFASKNFYDVLFGRLLYVFLNVGSQTTTFSKFARIWHRKYCGLSFLSNFCASHFFTKHMKKQQPCGRLYVP